MASQILSLSQSDGVAVVAPSSFSSLLLVSSADYTFTDGDGISQLHLSTGGSNRNVTLPSAANNTARRIRLHKADSGTGSLIIVTAVNGQTLNNVIKSQYGSCEVVSDGANWSFVRDVEERGSWTPTRSFSTANGTSADVSPSGWYKRTGRVIVFGGYLGITKGTATGNIRVDGLPYVASSASNRYTATSSIIEDRLSPPGGAYGQYSYIVPSGTLIHFIWTNSGGGAAGAVSTAINATDMGTSLADVFFGGTYLIG